PRPSRFFLDTASAGIPDQRYSPSRMTGHVDVRDVGRGKAPNWTRGSKVELVAGLGSLGGRLRRLAVSPVSVRLLGLRLLAALGWGGLFILLGLWWYLGGRAVVGSRLSICMNSCPH